MSVIYYKSGSAAMADGEIELYRASNAENERTRDVIDNVISESFDGFHLARDTVRNVLFNADPDRVALVLANTLSWRDGDGRFSRASRTWAAGIRLPDHWTGTGADNSCFYACRTHSAILEGFITQFRRYLGEVEA